VHPLHEKIKGDSILTSWLGPVEMITEYRQSKCHHVQE